MRLLPIAITSASRSVLVGRRREDDDPACYQSPGLLQRAVVWHHRRTDALPAISSECCRQTRDGHQAMRSYLACAPPTVLASRGSASCSRLQPSSTGPCPATPGLPGRRLSARRRRPCQTTAFCRHSNSRCQSDAQQFWSRTFAAAGSRVWNSLPPNLRLCGLSYGQFRRLLKTFLFGQSGHVAVRTVFNCAE